MTTYPIDWQTSPVTGARLSSTTMVPNYALRSSIDDHVQRQKAMQAEERKYLVHQVVEERQRQSRGKGSSGRSSSGSRKGNGEAALATVEVPPILGRRLTRRQEAELPSNRGRRTEDTAIVFELDQSFTYKSEVAFYRHIVGGANLNGSSSSSSSSSSSTDGVRRTGAEHERMGGSEPDVRRLDTSGTWSWDERRQAVTLVGVGTFRQELSLAELKQFNWGWV